MHAKGNSTVNDHSSTLTNPTGKWYRRLLNIISPVYKTVSLVNLKIKSIGQKHYPEAFIISIDNLSFGGTGKTTLVMEIGEHLEKNRGKFAIVMRGYKSRFEKTGTKVQPHHTVRDVGDEAKMFKNRFPHQDIYVGKNRRNSIEAAIRDGYKIILLDDGFQTTGVYKNLKIMLFNPRHPFYYLRNFKFLMSREDVILFHQSPQSPGQAVDDGVIRGTYDFQWEGFYDSGGSPADSRDWAGAVPILGFSALGDNLRFKQDLSRRETPFHLAGFKGFNDHHTYTEEEIIWLEQRRIELNARCLVCTEKDFIKIKHLNLPNLRQIPLIYAKNSIKFNFDLMSYIFNMVQNAGKNKKQKKQKAAF